MIDAWLLKLFIFLATPPRLSLPSLNLVNHPPKFLFSLYLLFSFISLALCGSVENNMAKTL